MRFLIIDIFTLDHAEEIAHRKTLDSPVLTLNPGTRPEQFQLVRALRKKRGLRILFSRRKRALAESPTKDSDMISVGD